MIVLIGQLPLRSIRLSGIRFSQSNLLFLNLPPPFLAPSFKPTMFPTFGPFLLCAILFLRCVFSAKVPPTLDARIRGTFFGAVVADALTLGTHYEYDAKRIRQFYGKIDRFFAPGERTGGETHGVGWGARNCKTVFFYVFVAGVSAHLTLCCLVFPFVP